MANLLRSICAYLFLDQATKLCPKKTAAVIDDGNPCLWVHVPNHPGPRQEHFGNGARATSKVVNNIPHRALCVPPTPPRKHVNGLPMREDIHFPAGLWQCCYHHCQSPAGKWISSRKIGRA